jgi:hypothetical protein
MQATRSWSDRVKCLQSNELYYYKEWYQWEVRVFRSFDRKCVELYLHSHVRLGAGIVHGIALDYGLHDRWFEYRRGLGILLFTTVSSPSLGPTQPPIQWVPGALSLGVKLTHSPPSCVEVKNACICTSTTPIRLHGVEPMSTLAGRKNWVPSDRKTKSVKVKLSLCLTKYRTMKTLGEWKYSSTHS